MGCAASSAEFLPRSTSVERIERHRSIHELFVLGGRLGEGAYARVYCLQRASAGQGDDLAVKVTDLRKPSQSGVDNQEIDHDLKRRAERESRLLKLFQNQPRIIQFSGCLIESGIHYILMEKGQYGFRRVLEGTNVNEAFYASVFTQMLEALQVVHGLSVVHRDIKPDNFLFTEDFTVKLCDFGLAKRLSCSRSTTSGVNGTPPFMSPEMVNGCAYSTKTDMWSFGVTAYVLLYGTFPYLPEEPGLKSMQKKIGLGYPAPAFRPCQVCDGIHVSDLAGKFLRLLLQREPSGRSSAKDALKHQWLAVASTKPKLSLPSLQPMLISARAVGAFSPMRTDVFAAPDGLDDFLAVQQEIYKVRRRKAVARRKPSSGASTNCIVPRQPTSVPGVISSSAFCNLDAVDPENTLKKDCNFASQVLSETMLEI